VMTMKNVVFWDIKAQFVTHKKHITSPLLSPAGFQGFQGSDYEDCHLLGCMNSVSLL
jgi:hypothetical protein